MKQISFERYIWMIAKTEIANDSKIRLRFENLTGKKTIRKFVKFQNGQKIKQISNGRKIILRFENLFVN